VTIWLVGLVVHIEVIVIIQQVGNVETKAVIMEVVVVIQSLESVESMDGLQLLCWGSDTGSGSAVEGKEIQDGGSANSNISVITVILYNVEWIESSVVMAVVVLVVVKVADYV